MAVNIPFLITKADIVSTRTGIIYQIANNISDLEIFENIEKPYLTGQLSFIDTGGILERINFTGSDIIEIDIQDAVSEDENPISLVNRKFVIDRVLAIRKADGDGTNQIDLHLMELHGWIDQVINAGIVLGGDRQEMIRRLLVEFLPPSEGPQTEPGLKLIKSAGYADVHRRYIIPENTTPLTACKTITESDTNVNGYPYFLYSAINNIGLRYQSLEQLLNEGPVLNENNPFVWNGTELFHQGVSPSPSTKLRFWANYSDCPYDWLAGIIDSDSSALLPSLHRYSHHRVYSGWYCLCF